MSPDGASIGYGNVIVVLVLALVACAALLHDPWERTGMLACFLVGMRFAWLQYKEGRAVHQRLREERAAGYQTLGAMMRPDIPLLDARTGELGNDHEARKWGQLK